MEFEVGEPNRKSIRSKVGLGKGKDSGVLARGRAVRLPFGCSLPLQASLL